MNTTNLHQGQPLARAGQPLDQAQAALILLHGRGATAASILLLAEELYHPAYAYLAPQAAHNSWYPYTFLAPIPQNEPWLSAALQRVGQLVDQIEAAGVPAERIVLGGFSQGACLASEFIARNARRYGGLIGFSGGLIGPLGMVRAYAGSLEGTPVFLGCSDVDGHIPKARVEETADVLEGLGAQVTMRLYPGMGHTINADEIEQARALLAAALPPE